MPRKTIELPATFVFSMEYQVLYTDVNNANHLGADRVLPIAMEAQLRLIKHLGYDTAIAFEDAGLIMAHSEIAYLSEASYGDNILVEVGSRNFKSKSFDLIYRLSKPDHGGQEMARVATTLLFFDYEKACVVPVPEEFPALFNP